MLVILGTTRFKNLSLLTNEDCRARCQNQSAYLPGDDMIGVLRVQVESDLRESNDFSLNNCGKKSHTFCDYHLAVSYSEFRKLEKLLFLKFFRRKTSIFQFLSTKLSNLASKL